MKKTNRLLIPLINLCSLIRGLFYRRNTKNVLFGSWGGTKFADNSRYLYQFLFQNKDKLKLNKVIWVTRDETINKTLNNLGYESYLIGTKESKIWHLKCGIHIICNMSFGFGDFDCDLDSRYSCGAKKIQLWHGVGIKSIGRASNQYRQPKNRLLHNRIVDTIFSLGCWKREFFLCTSDLNLQINYQTNSCIKKRMFVTSYPRNCECIELLENEKKIISSIKSFKGAILYLPTFRKDLNSFFHPLKDCEFLKFIKEENLAFIEKPHSASKYTLDITDPNIIYLRSSFDINVLYDHVTCVITDYSSSAFDSIHKKVPMISFVPDLNKFKYSDVGLLMDIENLFGSLIAKDVNALMERIRHVIECRFFSEDVNEIYRKVDSLFYDGRQKNMMEIWKDILSAINKGNNFNN